MTGCVSILVAAYNAGAWIRESIDSALQQTGPPLEVIVVDDGSTDGTASILQSYGPRITVVGTSHRGAAAARNTAFRASTGEFVAILDADDRLRPGAFSPKLELLARETSAGVAYGDAMAIDERGSPTGPIPSPRHLTPADNPLDALVGSNLFAVHAALSRRAVLASLPYLHHEELDLVGDWDLWLRVAGITRFAYSGDMAAEYRQHGAMSLRALTPRRGLRQTLNTLMRAFELPALGTVRDSAKRAALRRMLLLALRLRSPEDVERVGRLWRQAVDAKWVARSCGALARTPGAVQLVGAALNAAAGPVRSLVPPAGPGIAGR